MLDLLASWGKSSWLHALRSKWKLVGGKVVLLLTAAVDNPALNENPARTPVRLSHSPQAGSKKPIINPRLYPLLANEVLSLQLHQNEFVYKSPITQRCDPSGWCIPAAARGGDGDQRKQFAKLTLNMGRGVKSWDTLVRGSLNFRVVWRVILLIFRTEWATRPTHPLTQPSWHSAGAIYREWCVAGRRMLSLTLHWQLHTSFHNSLFTRRFSQKSAQEKLVVGNGLDLNSSRTFTMAK